VHTPRTKSRWLGRDAVYFALIGIAELVIFFNDYRHFFMGDTLLWIGYRYHSIAEFFRGFIEVDPTLWYRPLAQRTVVSVLYPLTDLNPIPYRVVSFALFFACTVAVFVVTKRLTQSRRTAWLSTLFFAPHVTHAFVTYDPAYLPELFYVLFFVASVICWVAWLRTRNRNAWIASAALFAGSLFSKETAVALPFTLLAVWLFFPRENRPRLRTLAPHFVLLGCYLIFAIGYLHIRTVSFQKLIENPGVAGHPGYQLVLGKNVTDSISIAFSWAFNIGRGGYGQWPPIKGWMVDALKVVRVLICVAAFFALFSSRRRYVLTGVAWFLIGAAPTLPLLDHFLPQYVFGPLVGFSIAVGASLDWAYEWCSRYSRPLAFASCVLVLGLVTVINAGAARRVAVSHSLLGGSAKNAQNGMNDMLALYPRIPKGTTLVIFDEESPSIPWYQAFGMLYQLAYQDESLRTEYSSGGITTTGNDLNSGRALAFKSADGHLVDITRFVKQRPDLLLPHTPDAHYQFKLSKSVVRAGSDSYVVRIPELLETDDVTLNVLRAYNGIVEEPFPLKMIHQGRVEIPVGGETKPGEYTFVAVQRPGETGWVTVSGTIQVQ
jgi:hypothetical protein